jgi:voltage-gated potassium channel
VIGGARRHASDLLFHIANRPRRLAQVTVGIYLVCAALYAVLEDKGPVEGMWWAIVTASTVGYGDQYPETTMGRAVGAVLIVTFVLFVLPMITAQITARLLTDPNAFTDAEQVKIMAHLEHLVSEVALLQSLQKAPAGVEGRPVGSSEQDVSNRPAPGEVERRGG